jgi:hypothetical protein
MKNSINKTSKLTLLSAAAALLLSVSACKKYPDGPNISFTSATDRVTNNWKVEEALDNGKDVTADYTKYELDNTKGGSSTLTAKYKWWGTEYEYVTTGTWKFMSDEAKIAFDFSNDDADGIYTILKLEEDKMWIKKDGEPLELHLMTR